jgi:hypothetical protein
MLDREVTDVHGRALGYVWSSNDLGDNKTFVTLEMLKRGLVFPFVFESATDFIPSFLAAAKSAKQANKGVWKNYQHASLPFSSSFASPKKHTDAEPAAQQNAKLNLPVVIRRVVDAFQLKNLGLKLAFAEVRRDRLPRRHDRARQPFHRDSGRAPNLGATISSDAHGRAATAPARWEPRSFSTSTLTARLRATS